MGLCSKLTVSKKIIDRKITEWIKIKKDKGWSRAYLEEKRRVTSLATKKITIKWINEEKYLTTERIIKSLNIKKIKIIISLKIKKINRKRQKANKR